MAPPKKVPVAVAPGIRTKLEALATAAGLDLEAYVVAVLSGHVIGTTPTSGNRGGRPVSVVPDDLPPDIERANNATGFVGVARVGRHYTARVGRQLIGRFSSVELAASVRYYALRGFRLGRGAMFAANGLPVEEAVEMAARAGFAFEATTPEVAVDDVGSRYVAVTRAEIRGRRAEPHQSRQSAEAMAARYNAKDPCSAFQPDDPVVVATWPQGFGAFAVVEASSAPSCTVCKDTGKMPIRGVAGGSGRWWPCECPAGADVDKPTDWDVTGASVIGNQPDGYVMDEERG